MAYNSGYGGSNPYGPGGNTYDNPPPSYNQSYGNHDEQSYTQSYNQSQNQPQNQSYNQGYGQSNLYNNNPPSHEMQNLPSQHQQPQPTDPHRILNECKAVTRAIQDLESRLPTLQAQQKQYLGTSSVSAQQLQSTSADIMTGYRGLTDRVRRIKGLPGADSPQNASQVGALDRRIKGAVREFQEQEARFRREVGESQKRQYKIINPDATESELNEVASSGEEVQLFQQALLRTNRTGQAQSTLSNVKDRHKAIEQIERTMMELNQLFQDLDRIIVEQEPMIENIEQKAVETQENVQAGNVHMEGAVTSARAARKKKWMCLGIGLLILLIIAVVVAVVVEVMKKK